MLKHILIYGICAVCYLVIKKIGLEGFQSLAIDTVELDAGIPLIQARAFKTLSFWNPTWLTSTFGYPQQYTFVMTDNFIIFGILFTGFQLFGLSETVSLNLVKIIFNSLAGYFTWIYLRSLGPIAVPLALIFQSCFFILNYSYHVQLQSHFLFPLLLILLNRYPNRSTLALLGSFLTLSYFLSAYYFIFFSIVIGIWLVAQWSKLKPVDLLCLILPLILLLPFLIPQALIALERKRSMIDLTWYSFRISYYLPFLERPIYGYTAFLGYGFTIVLIFGLVRWIGASATAALVALLLLSGTGPYFKGLVSFVIPLFAFFARNNKAVAFGAFLLIGLSLGAVEGYVSLLSVLVDSLPQLKSIRIPVRYFVAGVMLIFLISARLFSRKDFTVITLASLIFVTEIVFYKPQHGPIPRSFQFKTAFDRVFIYGWPRVSEHNRMNYDNYAIFNQIHLARLFSPDYHTFLINSGYHFYKLDSVLRRLDDFPSPDSIRVIKLLNFDYVAATKRRRSPWLALVERQGPYFLYRIKGVPFDSNFIIYAPSYSNVFQIVWRSKKACIVEIKLSDAQGSLQKSFKTTLSEKKKVDFITIPGNLRFKTNPVELEIKPNDCERVWLHSATPSNPALDQLSSSHLHTTLKSSD